MSITTKRCGDRWRASYGDVSARGPTERRAVAALLVALAWIEEMAE